MDKKDFIFPGVILGLVIITALGLLLTHQDSPQLIPSEAAATSTESTSVGSTTISSTLTPVAPGHSIPTAHTPSAYYPYGTITLSLNQAAQFKDAVSVRPISVVEDSRCPVEVECIQAGTVKVSLRVSVNRVSNTETVQLGKSITVGHDTITLQSVSPARSRDGAPAGSAYRFTFFVAHMQ